MAHFPDQPADDTPPRHDDSDLAASAPRRRESPTLTSTPAPWPVLPEHRWSYALTMLRLEQRRRTAGDEFLTERDRERLSAWRRMMRERNVVVEYDPDIDGGFHYVTRRPGIDLDLLRNPRF